MNIVKFISAAKLDEYIRTEVAERLRANDIRDLNSYAYVDESSIDSDYLGHSEHPLGSDFRFANTSFGASLSRSLKPWEEQLSISYGDFDGLMGSARLAIGLALFHGDLLKQNVFEDQSLFEHHNLGAIVILAMASDRLRDFFISAVLNKTTKEYEAGKYNDQKRTRYVTPFSEAIHICRSAAKPLPELLRKADIHAPRLYEYIERRNKLVHEIATEWGRWEKARLGDPSLPEQDLRAYFSAERHRRIAAEHEQRVAEALNSSMDWYKLLVRASSDIFEYSLRRYAGVRTA